MENDNGGMKDRQNKCTVFSNVLKSNMNLYAYNLEKYSCILDNFIIGTKLRKITRNAKTYEQKQL